MKTNFFIEYSGRQTEEKLLTARAKELWINEGNKIKDIVSLSIYLKPEENKAYVVINNEYHNSFCLDE